MAGATFYFYELDGKHSEVEGQVSTTLITERNVDEVVEQFLLCDGDNEKIFEQLHEIDTSMYDQVAKDNETLMKQVSLVTVTKVEWSD